MNVERFGTFMMLLTLGVFVFLCAVGGMFWAQESYSIHSPNGPQHHQQHHHHPIPHSANEPAADPMQGIELGVRQVPE